MDFANKTESSTSRAISWDKRRLQLIYVTKNFIILSYNI